jgi:carbon monoxide dehydrogenase subunit G
MALSVTKMIAAPPEQVFQALTDFERAAETIQGITQIEMLSDGPVGPGTRFRQTRMMFGKEATEEMHVSAWEESKSYTLAAESCGARYASHFLVEPVPGGSQVTMTMEVTPLTFFAKLMSPLGKWMHGMVKKCVEQDMDDVRRNLEPSAV